MSKHTPGPWMVAKDNPRKVVSHSIDGLDPLTGENLVGGASEGPYAAANARLIALAPEMKEALESIAAVGVHEIHDFEAIAKRMQATALAMLAKLESA